MTENQHAKEKSFIGKVGIAVTIVVGIGSYVFGCITGVGLAAAQANRELNNNPLDPNNIILK